MKITRNTYKIHNVEAVIIAVKLNFLHKENLIEYINLDKREISDWELRSKMFHLAKTTYDAIQEHETVIYSNFGIKVIEN